METFVANLKRAIRDHETVSIGGGEFSPSNMRTVVAVLETAQAHAAALQEIAKMLSDLPEAKVGNSKVHYCLCQARNAIRGAK